MFFKYIPPFNPILHNFDPINICFLLYINIYIIIFISALK